MPQLLRLVQPSRATRLQLALAANAAHIRRMNCGDCTFIWQAPDWPRWRYDLSLLAEPIARVSRAQGELLGRLADVGMSLRDEANVACLTRDVITTSEIEGEQPSVASVRSSIARRLGVDIGALAPVDRHADGMVDMVLDVTTHHGDPLPNCAAALHT